MATNDAKHNDGELMQALVQRRYGGPETFELTTVPRPQPGSAEVVIEVEAAGVDRGTWHLMTGRPYLLRLMGFGLRRPKNLVPGRDVSGRVVAVGSAVTRFAPGDRVFGVSEGSFAQQAVVREDKLAKAPQAVTLSHAAALGISGLTALQALRDAGGLKAGQRVLILGASGGVGTYAVQLAKAFGAHVTAVCSGGKAELVRRLGADEVVDYRSTDFVSLGRTFDVVIDAGGGPSMSRLARVLVPRGTAVLVGSEGGGALAGGFLGRMFGALIHSLFRSQRFVLFMAKENAKDLEVLASHVERRSLTPIVEKAEPLENGAAALAALERGEVRGKIVVEVAAREAATRQSA